MRIGIAAPVDVMALKVHLNNLTPADLQLGLGATVVNILIDGFIKLGHSVTVFTLDPSVKETRVLQGDNLKIIMGSYRFSAKKKMLDFDKKEFDQINKYIEQYKDEIDIVNAHWSYEYAIGTILAKVPHLITFRDHAYTILKMGRHPYVIVRYLMDKWVRKKAENISFNSPYLKSAIKMKGVVIPNPTIMDNIVHPRRYPEGKEIMKIAFIANGWDYRKNPLAAIESVNILREKIPNVELHLFGFEYELNNKGWQETKKKGWLSGIHFRGGIDHSQLMSELIDFDILLHTSREESFGNTLLEAMAIGIPVVGGKNSGAVPWVLDNGIAGCLTDVENPIKIADDLNDILTKKEYYEKLSIAGINNVKTRFSQEEICRKYLSVYNRILRGENVEL